MVLKGPRSQQQVDNSFLLAGMSGPLKGLSQSNTMLWFLPSCSFFLGAVGRWDSLGAQMTAGKLGKQPGCEGCWTGPGISSIPRGLLVLGPKRAFKEVFAAELCMRGSPALRDWYCSVPRGRSQCRSESVVILGPQVWTQKVRRHLHILPHRPGPPED